MSGRRRRAIDRAAISALIVTSVFVAGGALGGRINTTKSIPVGLYWQTNSPADQGAYVMFCPPKSRLFDAAKERGYIGSGFCGGGYGFVMKKILAAKNDVVDIDAEGVRVNGELLPLSRPLASDKAGRSLPRYPAAGYRLADNEVLLMSDVSGTSFDARYFGPVDRAQIKVVVRPVWTW